MIMKLKIALVAAAFAVVTSPLLAQSLYPREGTGNVLPFEYGPGGTRLYGGEFTGGGSTGYNDLLLQH